MRLVLCLLLVIVLPGSAVAQTAANRTMPLSQAQAAADKGDAGASAALMTTVDQDTCLSGCASRGYDKGRCATACRPGFCHPDGETPYCVAK